ncbi:sulfatase-like hydrolase/transferase [Xanthobacter aminoxidans]|uniref:sulfatase-like hydrolase/transferase n=1 Tax=Xanthobacter aminoxidans TaxID=186280 RepID=UPI003729EE6E
MRFDEFYGTIIGAGSFYWPNTLTRGNENAEHEAKEDPNFFYTDAISTEAADFIHRHAKEHAGTPFFQYVAYTAPHWPLHAHPEDIAKYKGRFDAGWDELREERLSRMIKSGLIHPDWKLTDRDPTPPPWTEAEERAWLARCMEVYAAQIDRMDQGIGRVLKALEDTGQMDDTLVIFLSDNGACAEDIPEDVSPQALVEELMIAHAQTRDGRPVRFGNIPEIMPGAEDIYQSYGVAWANLSNTPFRLNKHWVHEGGIATPLILHWPAQITAGGELRHVPGQLPDIMATILDVTGAAYPQTHDGNAILPCEGVSLAPSFPEDGERTEPMFWEHEGNAAVRVGQWKLVRKYPGRWELYDMEADRTELHDLSADHPERVQEMIGLYQAWAERCGVILREKILELMKAQGAAAFWEEEE